MSLRIQSHLSLKVARFLHFGKMETGNHNYDIVTLRRRRRRIVFYEFVKGSRSLQFEVQINVGGGRRGEASLVSRGIDKSLKA